MSNNIQNTVRRSSILKNKNNSSEKKIVAGTTIPQSVTFKETQHISDVRQFIEDSPIVRHQFDRIEVSDPPYSELMLTKDINFIHALYRKVISMISTHGKKNSQQNNQCRNVASSVLQLIENNLLLKDQIDQQYKKMDNLHQLALYLRITPEQLLSDSCLANFIEHYKDKESELRWLQIKCKNKIQEHSKRKRKSTSGKERRSRQKRREYLKRQLLKQKERIGKLEQQQKKMLKQLYRLQRTNNMQEKTTSSLKMQITELECKQSYQKLKKQKQQLRMNSIDKENNPPEKQAVRHQRIKSIQRIVSKKSLGKLFRK